MDQHFDLVGRVVVHVLDLDLAFVVGGDDRIDERSGGGAVRELGNRENVFGLTRCNRRPHLNFSASFAVVVISEIGGASRRKVRPDTKRFALKVIDRGPAQVVEIVGQDLGRESDRDAFGAF